MAGRIPMIRVDSGIDSTVISDTSRWRRSSGRPSLAKGCGLEDEDGDGDRDEGRGDGKLPKRR